MDSTKVSNFVLPLKPIFSKFAKISSFEINCKIQRMSKFFKWNKDNNLGTRKGKIHLVIKHLTS